MEIKIDVPIEVAERILEEEAAGIPKEIMLKLAKVFVEAIKGEKDHL